MSYPFNCASNAFSASSASSSSFCGSLHASFSFSWFFATPILDWRLDAPSPIQSLSIQLEGLAPAGRGKVCLVVSIPVCKHTAPVPDTWREIVHIPPPFSEDERWRLAATLEPASSPSHPIRFEYPIPDEALPIL